jgi:hypothetical protein
MARTGWWYDFAGAWTVSVRSAPESRSAELLFKVFLTASRCEPGRLALQWIPTLTLLRIEFAVFQFCRLTEA